MKPLDQLMFESRMREIMKQLLDRDGIRLSNKTNFRDEGRTERARKAADYTPFNN